MIKVVSPLVSVVIPTYNHAQYLRRALLSVLDQTYVNWEVIVIDNHSTDNTDEVMEGFVGPHITYLKIHNNGVIASSRNAGIRAARGEWIAFLDSDDWWTKDKLQVCLACIYKKVDFIYHDLEIIGDESRHFRRKIIKSWQLKPPVLMDLFLKGNAVANSSAVVRKSLLERVGGINESKEMVAAEDYNTWLHIAKLTDQFVYLPLKLGYYFQHNNNTSQKDMSSPYKKSTNEFIDSLNELQRSIIEGNAEYMSAKYFYMKNNCKAASTKAIAAIVSGRGRGVLRATFLFIKIIYRQMTNIIFRKKNLL